MKANRFDVLKEMSKRNMKIKMFPSDNLQDVRTGKDRWGSLKMAIDNGTASELMGRVASGQSVMVILFVIDPEQYKGLTVEMDGEQ